MRFGRQMTLEAIGIAALLFAHLAKVTQLLQAFGLDLVVLRQIIARFVLKRRAMGSS